MRCKVKRILSPLSPRQQFNVLYCIRGYVVYEYIAREDDIVAEMHSSADKQEMPIDKIVIGYSVTGTMKSF